MAGPDTMGRRTAFEQMKLRLKNGQMSRDAFNKGTSSYTDMFLMDQFRIPVDQQRTVVCAQCRSTNVSMYETGQFKCHKCGRTSHWSPPKRNWELEGFSPEICPSCFNRNLAYTADGKAHCSDCWTDFIIYSSIRHVKGKPWWDPFFEDPFSCIHCGARSLSFSPIGHGKCTNCGGTFTWNPVKCRKTQSHLPASGSCPHCSDPRIAYGIDGWAKCHACRRWF